MNYDFTHKYNSDLFIDDNIIELNNNMQMFTYKKYIAYFTNIKKMSSEVASKTAHDIPTSTTIELDLKKRFQEKISNLQQKNNIDRDLDAIVYVNQKNLTTDMKTLAVKYNLYYKDIETYFKNRAYSKIKDLWNNSTVSYQKHLLDQVQKFNNYNGIILNPAEEAIIKQELKTNFCEYFELTLDGGYQKKKIEVNTGTKRANEGDAAQFLFLARAILSGFNCSNVDVRASSYDAVIDYETYLLRVQVKGINHDTINFKTATRGGAGNDNSAPTNEGKPITSKDCDIYVAVEKSSGICYIIPIDDIETYAQNNRYALPSSDKIKYKERWDLIEKKAKDKFGI